LNKILPKRPRLKLDSEGYTALHRQVLERDNWRCQACGAMKDLQVHHLQFRSQSGDDFKENLITLCADCHRRTHERSERKELMNFPDKPTDDDQKTIAL
jgi:5-methylcytosine-specific restriction endonuclease McrA